MPAARCRNCGAPLYGPYCARCGQHDLPPDPTLRELLAEAWDAFVSIDGKVLATVRMLLGRPGALTREYLAGHRARYVPPFRLYLVCSVLYFLISSFGSERAHPPADGGSTRAPAAVARPLGAIGDTAGRADSMRTVARRDSAARAALARRGIVVAAGPLDSAQRALAQRIRVDEQLEATLRSWPAGLSTRVRRGVGDAMRDGKGFRRLIAENIPRMLFVLVPVFALLLAVAYRSRRLRLPVHLIVALHLHAFVFAALVLGAIAGWLPDAVSSPLHVAIIIWMIGYVPLALRRVYGGRLRGAVLRGAALCAVYSVIAAIGTGALALVLLLTY